MWSAPHGARVPAQIVAPAVEAVTGARHEATAVTVDPRIRAPGTRVARGTVMEIGDETTTGISATRGAVTTTATAATTVGAGIGTVGVTVARRAHEMTTGMRMAREAAETIVTAATTAGVATGAADDRLPVPAGIGRRTAGSDHPAKIVPRARMCRQPAGKAPCTVPRWTRTPSSRSWILRCGVS